MKYREMSKNYIFRELECQMTKEEVAELCFKTVRTVTGWKLGTSEGWKRFKIHYDKLELPTGQLVTAEQILLGIGLLEIQSELEIKVSTQLLRLARDIERVKQTEKRPR
ncbi:regulator [Vibrio sp. nBUS_14]|uniref:regulator n=1 Tax=Vibrio sp. nBUS_14 TaxID=3395321 RepID=UPI003EBD3D04